MSKNSTYPINKVVGEQVFSYIGIVLRKAVWQYISNLQMYLLFGPTIHLQEFILQMSLHINIMTSV